MSCWHPSTVGSPRALIPPTSRRPRRSWKGRAIQGSRDSHTAVLFSPPYDGSVDLPSYHSHILHYFSAFSGKPGLHTVSVLDPPAGHLSPMTSMLSPTLLSQMTVPSG